MPERLPMTLRAYRRAMSAAPPLAGLWLKRRLKRGKEVEERLPRATWNADARTSRWPAGLAARCECRRIDSRCFR